jgi:Galactose oxidase, central domain
MKTRDVTTTLLVVVLCLVAVHGLAASPQNSKGNAPAEPAWVAQMRKEFAKGRSFDIRKVKYVPPIKFRKYALGNFNYKVNRVGFVGAQVVWDPINSEALLIGGVCGSMVNGFAGHWRVTAEKKWTRLEGRSAVLDPLAAKCLQARMPARDAENAARNVHFSGLDAAGESAMLKKRPAQLLTESVKLAETALTAISAATATGWEKQSLERALPLAKKAVELLKVAQAGFSRGQVNAELLAKCFDGQWKLDEAAGCLASSPGGLFYPFAAFDPERKCVVVFGGSHGDYVVNDTWIYECTSKTWRRVWPKLAPAPRCAFGSTRRGRVKKSGTLKWDPAAKRLLLSGGLTIIDYVYQQCGYMKPKKGGGDWRFDAGSGTWSGADGAEPGARVYRTVCKYHDPRWYDSEQKGSVAATRKWHQALKPNTWTLVPVPKGKRTMSSQSWGTAVLDPGRDLIFYWTGGHEADPTDVMPTYHIATNRWSIGYVPAMTGKGISLDGRADCANHTYKHYAYDPISKKIVMVHAAGTSVYNPDRADYDYNFDSNFHTPVYTTAAVSTPKGIYLWTAGKLRLFNEKARTWKNVKVSGKLPRPSCDCYAITYDTKRDVIWLTSHNRRKPRGGLENIWRFDIKTSTVVALDPKQHEQIGGKFRSTRESVYLPKLDLLVFNNFIDGQQAAYDIEKNTWRLLGISKPKNKAFRSLGHVGGGGLVYDARRDLVWATTVYRTMFVIKIDSQALKRK